MESQPNYQQQSKQKLRDIIQNYLKQCSRTEANVQQLFQIITSTFKYEHLTALCEVEFRQKKLYFIRHAQSTFNQWKNSSVFHLPVLYQNIEQNYDPVLTEQGHQQCTVLLERMKNDYEKSPILYDIVYISPLTRVFETFQDVCVAPQFDQVKNVICIDLIREQLGNACDIGTPLTLIKQRYQENNIDIQYLKDEKWWNNTPEGVEMNIVQREEQIQKEDASFLIKRILIFLLWVISKPEKNIAIVSHSNTYQYLTSFHKVIKDRLENGQYREILPGEIERFVISNLKQFYKS